MHTKLKSLTLAAAFTAIMAVAAVADVPQVMNYQGLLTNSSGTPYDGNKLVQFKIYDNTSSEIWNSGFINVIFDDGLFVVLLGASPQPALPSTAFAGDTLLTLGITVDIDPEITPRTRFTTVGFSFQSQNAQLLEGIPASEFAVLSANNNFSGATNTFQNNVLVTGNIGIRTTPTASYLIHIQPPAFATVEDRVGCYTDITNSLNGTLVGLYSRAFSSDPGNPGIVYGALLEGRSDHSSRYGLSSLCQAATFDITTGASYGVYGKAFDGNVAYGVYGNANFATTNWAGYFQGNVQVTGTLTKGGGAFRIDHPLDPENKILQHSFVESPDMMNVYNVNVITDNKGFATVELPDYFESLNQDFRYQLTVIGQFAQAVVSKEISGNRFVIQTDKPDVKVSWQVTGIRHDKWAEKNRIEVEMEKLPDQKGLYLHAEAYGLPVDKSVDREQIHESEKRRAESTANQDEK